MIILNNLYEDELKEYLLGLGMESYRGDQVFRSIHQKYINNIDDMNQLSLNQRQILKEEAGLRKIRILEKFQSKLDDTIKLLYLMEDKTLVEGVLMKYHHGYSLCVSSQVGCLMGCTFCASTKNGLIRDLEVSEILSQVYLVEKEFDVKISNIVMMGSGEPFDNYENVIKALKILNDPKGKHMSMRNMTISTCGIAPRIEDLAREDIPVNLAISLHSLDDSIRGKIMPINRKYNLESLFNSIKFYLKETGNRISFEYTVIDGENNRKKDIELMKKKFKNLNYMVNLIALNPIKAYNSSENPRDVAKEFKQVLDRHGINNTLRRELGSDISASCGQLKARYLEEGEGK